jgi:putative transposase
MHGTPEEKRLLAAWPLPRRPGWVQHVNEPLTERELEAIRRSVSRGNPYGDAPSSEQMTERLGLESTIRPRGRPKKQTKGS